MPPRPGLGPSQDRHCGVVDMDAVAGTNVSDNPLQDGAQRDADAADPIAQGRLLDWNALTGKALGLPVQRQVLAVFAEDNLSQQVRTGTAARQWMEGGRRLADRLARPARQLLAHVLDDLPGCRDALQAFGDVFADLAPFGSSTTWAGRRVGQDDTVTRQMRRQRTACRAAALEALHLDRIDGGDRDLRHDSRLGERLLQILQRQFELFQARAALG